MNNGRSERTFTSQTAKNNVEGVRASEGRVTTHLITKGDDPLGKSRNPMVQPTDISSEISEFMPLFVDTEDRTTTSRAFGSFSYVGRCHSNRQLKRKTRFTGYSDAYRGPRSARNLALAVVQGSGTVPNYNGEEFFLGEPVRVCRPDVSRSRREAYQKKLKKFGANIAAITPGYYAPARDLGIAEAMNECTELLGEPDKHQVNLGYLCSSHLNELEHDNTIALATLNSDLSAAVQVIAYLASQGVITVSNDLIVDPAKLKKMKKTKRADAFMDETTKAVDVDLQNSVSAQMAVVGTLLGMDNYCSHSSTPSNDNVSPFAMGLYESMYGQPDSALQNDKKDLHSILGSAERIAHVKTFDPAFGNTLKRMHGAIRDSRKLYAGAVDDLAREGASDIIGRCGKYSAATDGQIDIILT
jgi:hypothetical protein